MSLPELSYKKVWTSHEDFPTFEGSEEQVRLDNQYHPDAVRDFINGELIPALTGTGDGEGASQIGVFPMTALAGVKDVQGALEAILVLLQTITQGAVPDGSISSAKLGAAAVTGEKLADAAVTEAKIAAQSVTATKIASLAVTSAKLAASAVETDKIKDGAVAAEKIASSAVTASKISSSAVTAAKIGSAAVETAKLKDGAVVSGKIADGAVIASKIGSGAVSATKLADGAVTTAKFSSDAVAPAATSASKATKLANSRNFTIKDSSGTYSGAAVGFNGTAAVDIKMPATGRFDKLILGSDSYGSTLPSSGTTGQIFFKI